MLPCWTLSDDDVELEADSIFHHSKLARQTAACCPITCSVHVYSMYPTFNDKLSKKQSHETSRATCLYVRGCVLGDLFSFRGQKAVCSNGAFFWMKRQRCCEETYWWENQWNRSSLLIHWPVHQNWEASVLMGSHCPFLWYWKCTHTHTHTHTKVEGAQKFYYETPLLLF